MRHLDYLCDVLVTLIFGLVICAIIAYTIAGPIAFFVCVTNQCTASVTQTTEYMGLFSLGIVVITTVYQTVKVCRR